MEKALVEIHHFSIDTGWGKFVANNTPRAASIVNEEAIETTDINTEDNLSVTRIHILGRILRVFAQNT